MEIGDERLVYIGYHDGVSVKSIAPIRIGRAPYASVAIRAETLQGKNLTEIETESKDYADKNLAGFPLPDLSATPLNAGESFKWDGSQWVVFEPGSANSIEAVTAGAGLVGTGTTTVEIDIGAGQ